MVHAVVRAAEQQQNNPLIPAMYDIVWSAVCFAVILVFFWIYALPRMKKLLEERSAAIEGNIAKADAARKNAEDALDKYTAQLADARGEAARIRDQAREDGKQILAEMKAQATAEASRVSSQALSQIEAERNAAAASLRTDVGTLAIDLASGVIGEALNDDARASALVDRFLADLENSGTASSAGKH